jgi:hypothetical protein
MKLLLIFASACLLMPMIVRADDDRYNNNVRYEHRDRDRDQPSYERHHRHHHILVRVDPN